MTAIHTPRLTLASVDLPTYKAIFAGMPELSRYLNIRVPAVFSEFGLEPYYYSYEQVKANPANAQWWTYLFVHTARQALAGVGGYAGGPDEQGIVEIGYSIYENFQNQGLATEAAQGLIQQAFKHPDVTTVQAHTLAQENASVRVLKTCGMVFTNEIESPEDGLLWQWQMGRIAHINHQT